MKIKNILHKDRCDTCKQGINRLQRVYICDGCDAKLCFHCKKQNQKSINLCSNCNKDKMYYKEMILQYELKWNQQSLLYYIWQDSCKDYQLDYNYYLQKSQTTPLFENDYEIIHNDITQGRTDSKTFNRSLESYIESIQNGKETQIIRKQMENVLKAVILYDPLLGYCQGMNYIVCFLLCITDEAGAFNLFIYLIDKIIPNQFFQGTKSYSLLGFQAEQHFIKQILHVNCTTSRLEHLLQFVDLYTPQYLLTLLIQPLSASSLLVVWIEVFKKKSIIPILNTYLYILEKFQLEIDANKGNKQIDDIVTIQLCNSLIFLFSKEFDELKYVLTSDTRYFTPKEREIYLEQFHTNFSRKWIEDSNLIVYKLSKISGLNMEQTKIQQQKFFALCVLNKSDFITQKFGVNKNGFIQLISEFLDKKDHINQVNITKIGILFDLCDQSKTGLLDLREYMLCIYLFSELTFYDIIFCFLQNFWKSKNIERASLVQLATIFINKPDYFNDFHQQPPLNLFDVLQYIFKHI